MCREEDDDDLTPEDVFSRRWAQVVLARAREALQAEYIRRKKPARWQALSKFLREDPEPGEYEEAGKKIKLSAEFEREYEALDLGLLE